MVGTTSTQHKLEFDHLSSDDFEQLVLYLIHEDQKFVHYGRYGGPGDRGRDIVAYTQEGKSRKMWYFQCKRRKRIGPSLLEEELEKIHQHSNENPDFKPDEIVFATSCTVSAKTRDKIEAKAKEMGMSKPEFWARYELNVRVRNSPVTLDVFFGIGYSLLSTKFKAQSRRELKRVSSKYIPGLYTNRSEAEDYLSILVDPLGILKKTINEYWIAWKRQNIPHQGEAFNRFSSLLDQLLKRIELERSSCNVANIARIEELILEKIGDERTHFELEEDQRWSNYIDTLEHIMQNSLEWTKKQVFLIVDSAGTGKTNLLCKWVSDSLSQDSSFSTLLLTGNLSISNESGFPEYLMRQLEQVGAKISTLANLLNALQYYIIEECKPVVIIIDAINENRDIMSTNESLGQFLDDISAYPEIKVVVSCRTDFFKRFSFHYKRNNLQVIEGLLRGFTPEELQRAVPLYLTHFMISADFSDAALDALSNPFVLRMFCEAYGDTENSRVNQLGFFQDILLHKLIAKYEKRRFTDIQKKYPTAFRGPRPFQKCLLNIAKSMLDNSDNRIRIDDLPKECGPPFEDDSLYIRLLNEEIFIEEATSETETYVQFSSDSYREYRQARFLQSLYEESLNEFTSYISRLISENSGIMSEGLFRFLFIELRQRSKIDLWDIIDSGEAIAGSIEGLAQLEVGEIQDNDVIFIKSMIGLEYARILNLTFRKPNSPDWKLGLSLQDKLLSEMTRTKRDIMFGTVVCRSPDYIYNQIIRNLRNLISEIEKEFDLRKSETLVKSAFWLLGSNVEGLRYAANLALLELGIHKPEWMLNLIQEYWTVDDYYIRERFLSIVYALSTIDTEIAVSCAEQVKALFLDGRSKHYSTHLMIREFAREIVLIACGKDSQLLSKSQIEKIERINRPIEMTKRDYTRKRPQEEWTGFSNYPIKMDMKIYVFGPMAHYFNRHRCDATDVAIEIIHELGYTEDGFETIDKEILNKNWIGPNDDEVPTRIERFGKKYAWQAYRILQGQWIDALPFVSEWGEDILSFAYREFDPLFPKTDLISYHLGIDTLGNLPLDQWLEQPPTPIQRLVLRENDWVVVGGYVIQYAEEDRRVAFSIESLLVDPSVAQSRIKEIQRGTSLNIHDAIHDNCYNHEIEFDGLLSKYSTDEADESFVISGRSEFRLGNNSARYVLRADFIQTMGLTQEPRTMNFTNDDVDEIIRTQSWEFSPYESSEHPAKHSERGEWILVRSDLLKEYLQRKNKQLIIVLVVDRWGQDNMDTNSKISHDTHLIQ